MIKRKAIKVQPAGADYHIRVIGHTPTPLKDFYHALMRLPWSATILTISGGALLTNALFALGYMLTGGIANATPGSFLDAFFFSFQTAGTIGYGAMYPISRAANTLVVIESIISLTLTALATGLVFAKFSLPTARVQFAKNAVISPLNGVPTLMFRLGNERGNEIIDAQVRVVLFRTEHTAEGKLLYRMLDLKLTRERSISLSRSWNVFHPIDKDSPLYGQTPEEFLRQETEVHLMVMGVDDTTKQTIHAKHSYYPPQIRWGARFADVLTEAEDGILELDLRKFHQLEATQPTEDFPYPKTGDTSSGAMA